jgi:flagellar FliL protein
MGRGRLSLCETRRWVSPAGRLDRFCGADERRGGYDSEGLPSEDLLMFGSVVVAKDLHFCLAIMATSPTVLADTSISSSPAPAPTPVAAKFPIVPLLIAVVVGIAIAILGVGSVVYYLAHTGRLPVQGTAQKAEVIAPTMTHAMVLEPLLVNLADAGGSCYLRVALTLRVADGGAAKKGSRADVEKGKDDKGADDAVAAVRDTVLAVLGRQTADGLLAVDGKEHLKTELKTALAERNAELKVKDVFFTDFLVQR